VALCELAEIRTGRIYPLAIGEAGDQTIDIIKESAAARNGVFEVFRSSIRRRNNLDPSMTEKRTGSWESFGTLQLVGRRGSEKSDLSISKLARKILGLIEICSAGEPARYFSAFFDQVGLVTSCFSEPSVVPP